MFKKPGAPAAPVKKAAPPVAAPPKKLFGKTAAAPSKKASSKKSLTDDDAEDFGDDDSVTSGWGGAKKIQSELAGYSNRLQMKEETIVGKFGNDEPYANVGTHWFKRKGRQSFQCIGPKTCPLCAIGDKPRVSYLFNFIQFTDGAPVNYSWEVGIRVFRKLEKLAQNPKKAPLSRLVYEIERTGLQQSDTNYDVRSIRTADIPENHDAIHIPTPDEMAKVKLYTKADSLKNRASLQDMQEIVEEVTGGGEGAYDVDDADEE